MSDKLSKNKGGRPKGWRYAPDNAEDAEALNLNHMSAEDRRRTIAEFRKSYGVDKATRLEERAAYLAKRSEGTTTRRAAARPKPKAVTTAAPVKQEVAVDRSPKTTAQVPSENLDGQVVVVGSLPGGELVHVAADEGQPLNMAAPYKNKEQTYTIPSRLVQPGMTLLIKEGRLLVAAVSRHAVRVS